MELESDGIGRRWNWKAMENKTIEAQGDQTFKVNLTKGIEPQSDSNFRVLISRAVEISNVLQRHYVPENKKEQRIPIPKRNTPL